MSQQDLDEVDRHIDIVKVLGLNSKEEIINYANKHIPEKRIYDERRLYFIWSLYNYTGLHLHAWLDFDIARTKKAVLEL